MRVTCAWPIPGVPLEFFLLAAIPKVGVGVESAAFAPAVVAVTDLRVADPWGYMGRRESRGVRMCACAWLVRGRSLG